MIVSNIGTTVAEMNESVFAYPVKKVLVPSRLARSDLTVVGLQMFADATGLHAVSHLLWLENTKPVKLRASYTPGAGSKARSFGLHLTLPTTDSVRTHLVCAFRVLLFSRLTSTA